jgi:exodeoxyribonuclease VII small subunit
LQTLNFEKIQSCDERSETKRKEENIMAKANFEDNMKKLEEIVDELEKGELNLDDSISKFEDGIKLSKECNKILEDAEKKITILLEKDGNIEEEKFSAE